MNISMIKLKIASALNELYGLQGELFENDINEVTINHYLADYLKKYFPGYDVDTEYNREHIPQLNTIGTKKTIMPDGTEKNIKPDIIIHRRNKKVSNLLVIQCKKQWNKDKEERKKRLEYIKRYDYEFKSS